MARAEEAVMKISGRAYRECYQDLACAVEVAYEHLPKRMDMQDIAAEAGARLGRGRDTVSKALARAAEDAWDNGGRSALEELHGFREKPSPKELVMKLAWSMDGPVEYRLWREGTSGRYGIVARERREGHGLVLTPLGAERTRMERFVRFLNQVQAPLEDFQELLMDSGLLEAGEEGGMGGRRDRF